MISFKMDEKSKKEFEQFLKEAAELPKREMSTAAKNGAKIALEKVKDILPDDGYKMKFKDGNTWTTTDIKNNLTISVEKTSRSKIKRVARVGIKDWRVDLYSNFVEYGFTNPKSGAIYPATHFMRDGLTKTNEEVRAAMIESLRASLDKIRSD